MTSSVGPVAVERNDRTDTEVALEGDRADRTAEDGREEDMLCDLSGLESEGRGCRSHGVTSSIGPVDWTKVDLGKGKRGVVPGWFKGPG